MNIEWNTKLLYQEEREIAGHTLCIEVLRKHQNEEDKDKSIDLMTGITSLLWSIVPYSVYGQLSVV